MISREQIKAARAMLDWSQKTLTERCGTVSEATIKLIETGKINSTPETLGAIQKTLEDAGIEFLPQQGLRFRDDLLTVIEKDTKGDNAYLKLLDDIFYTMKGTYGEVLNSFIDNSLSSQQVIDREMMLRKEGIVFRNLVRHDDTYLLYPLDEYRFLPKGLYLNNPITVYGEKVAFNVQNSLHKNTDDAIIIIKNSYIAEIKRREFEIIWKYCEQPTTTTAGVTYD
ncbi:MAG: hypothetical protein CO093_06190 [Alphaproteobacteria bacterium CG_4_9_14_3_um_filter_47_13]|nr:MAG: hypothetical protein CO093_06190 [Alphaproteobacteria bacterium CG_4_9_14_3_um_filter_47_13]